MSDSNHLSLHDQLCKNVGISYFTVHGGPGIP